MTQMWAEIVVGVALIAGMSWIAVLVAIRINEYFKGVDKMAKLEGVKIIDIQDGEITKIAYEGEHYVNVGDVGGEGGDIGLRTERGDFSYARAGEYYLLFEEYGIRFKDDEGDRTHVHERFGYFTYFRKKDTPSLEERVDDLEKRAANFEKDRDDESDYKPEEGDIVVITANTNSSRNAVGDIGKVVDEAGIGDFLAAVEVPGKPDGPDENGCLTLFSEMRLADAEEKAKYYREVAEMEKPKLAVGDYAKVVGNTVFDDISEGTVVRITDDVDFDGDYRFETINGRGCGYAKPESLEKYDVAGRGIGEFRAGDVVRVTNTIGSSSIKVGQITEVHSHDGIGSPLVHVIGGGTRYAKVDLIAPVESRVDIDGE